MRKFIFIIACLLPTLIYAQNNTIKIKADKKKSTVTYDMVHPLHEWQGVNKQVNAIILYNPRKKEINKAAVSLAIAEFNSHNANRDSHTMEVLDAIDHPLITFLSTSISAPVEDTLTIKGILDFHNVKKNITFKAAQNIDKKQIVISGKFDVDMTDYNIQPPSMMGMAANKIIKMSFKVVFDLP